MIDQIPFSPVVSASGNITHARTNGAGIVQVRFKDKNGGRGRLYQNTDEIPPELCGEFSETFDKESKEASTGSFFHAKLKQYKFVVVPEDE